MPRPLIGRTGIKHEARHGAAPRHRSIALVELITTVALALSTAVALGDGVPLAIALCIALLLAAMGGLTAIVVGDPRRD